MPELISWIGALSFDQGVTITATVFSAVAAWFSALVANRAFKFAKQVQLESAQIQERQLANSVHAVLRLCDWKLIGPTNGYIRLAIGEIRNVGVGPALSCGMHVWQNGGESTTPIQPPQRTIVQDIQSSNCGTPPDAIEVEDSQDGAYRVVFDLFWTDLYHHKHLVRNEVTAFADPERGPPATNGHIHELGPGIYLTKRKERTFFDGIGFDNIRGTGQEAIEWWKAPFDAPSHFTTLPKSSGDT
jgi:hypothetical protein